MAQRQLHQVRNMDLSVMPEPFQIAHQLGHAIRMGWNEHSVRQAGPPNPARGLRLVHNVHGDDEVDVRDDAAAAEPGFCCAASRTARVVGSRTQSMRRSTVKGRITLPYSWGRYLPRTRSATDQINEDRF